MLESKSGRLLAAGGSLPILHVSLLDPHQGSFNLIKLGPGVSFTRGIYTTGCPNTPSRSTTGCLNTPRSTTGCPNKPSRLYYLVFK